MRKTEYKGVSITESSTTIEADQGRVTVRRFDAIWTDPATKEQKTLRDNSIMGIKAQIDKILDQDG